MKIACLEDGSPEIFSSIQGEGRSSGCPVVFIRASLCNLSCFWCDTAYTWNWEGTEYSHQSGRKFLKSEQIVDLSIEEVAECALSFQKSHYVFTGGEPLLQEKNWIALMDHFTRQNNSSFFEIETNGTLLPKQEFLSRIHQLNVSPKLANSQVPEKKRYKPEILCQLATTGKADFKFVIDPTESKDQDEVWAIIEECELPSNHIFLMPKASTGEELLQNQSAVATLAEQSGFRFSDRLHIRLYGNKRGV